MDRQRYELMTAPWPIGKESCSRIRREVFIVEQGVTEEEEWDGLDEAANHFLVLENRSAQAIACARLLSAPDVTTVGSVKVTRMAVLRDHRRQGVGGALLREMLNEAMRRKCSRVELDAQLQAVSFYKKAGFRERGKPFVDAGIQHVKMIKELV